MIEHVQYFWKGYVAVAVLLLPVLYYFRRQMAPVILWTGEGIIYLAVFHIAILALIKVTSWFRVSTRMHWQDKTPPDWNMPLWQVWKHTEYNPHWIVYVELAALVGIAYYMIRYRPIAVQRLGPKREHTAKGYVPKAGSGRSDR
ncbi:MAG: hypothetical protein GY851_00870, partial [bacterium]|nr:hypothetical protein [bacterium]